MKEVPANKKKSLGKLPTPVRNKMGYMEEGGSVPKAKKKRKLNMPLEEFAKLTPEEKAAYKRQGDEMSRKTKEGYDKAKKRNFREGGGVKKYDPMEDARGRRDARDGKRYSPKKDKTVSSTRPPKSISNLFRDTVKNLTTKGGKKTSTPTSKRYDELKKKRKTPNFSKKGMNCGGMVIMDRNYLKGK